MRIKVGKKAIIWIVEYLVHNLQAAVLRLWVEQSLYRHAVRKQKDDSQQCEAEQFNHLHRKHIDAIGRVSYLIYVSMRHYVLTTSGDNVVFSYDSVFELLLC